ncbi:MAG: EscU/YscU/HrcU family type III secretion system export apparatus switch protein [Luteimonas sp.]|nr:EscU/YscU/HrcU family type III secretion system export apparatus switch protein [Luteimonas sp.]
MSEQNAQDRNLPASERKLKKAREEGQVARSRDFGHFAAIAVCGAMLVTAAPWAADWLKQTLMQGLQFDRAAILDTAFMGERLLELTLRLMWVIVPFGAVMMATALAGCIAIGGWNWTLKPVMPNFGKLNPITGLPAIVTKDKLIDAAKGSVLALVLGAIGALYLKGHVDELAGVLALPLPAAIQQAASAMVGGLGLLLLALAAFAMIDVPLQRHHHAQRLKMSHQELKQEHKELEGNQEIKAKLRARMREMTKRRMLAAVPDADLVVMNPTHYAVALKYDDKKMGAPRVVAKGADLLAMKIRDLAKDAKVPVLQAPVLARALYAHAELDREIPAALFGAVAQVLAYVYQLRAALAGQVAMPNALPELNVPEELDPHHKPVPGMEVFD